jgi:hypothetical protein
LITREDGGEPEPDAATGSVLRSVAWATWGAGPEPVLAPPPEAAEGGEDDEDDEDDEDECDELLHAAAAAASRTRTEKRRGTRRAR